MSIGKAPQLASLLVLLLAAVCLWAARQLLPDAEHQGETDGTEAEQAATQAAEQRWQSLWTAIETEGEQTLAPDLPDRGIRAAGDTVFMRYRDLWDEVDKTTRLRFQLLAAANDSALKRDLLSPLLQSEDPHIRYRALLEQARIAVRKGDNAQARSAATAALAVAPDTALWSADALFVLAYTAAEQSDWASAETYLNQSIRADPGFWDARQLRIPVLARLLGNSDQSAAACLDRTRSMIEDLGALPALAQSRTQFRDVADRFSRLRQTANPALALVAGLGYRWAGEVAKARTALQTAQQTAGKLPRRCLVLIRERARQVLQQLPQ